MTTLTRTRIAAHRHWIYLIAAAVGVFFLFPQIIGFQRAANLLRRADSLYLTLALVAEGLRYLVSAGSTVLLARLFRRSVGLGSMTLASFAGSAANRTFSTGGAPGMLVRLLFLTRHQITAGEVAVIFLIEDIAGFVVGSLVLLVGILALVNVHPSASTIAQFGSLFALGSALAGLALIYVYRRRTWVERAVHGLARGTSLVISWLTGRSIYSPVRVHRAIRDFYAGMSLARRHPTFVAGVFALNLLRYVAGVAALYLCFLAFGWTISPGILILLYTSASTLSTISAVPGEVAILGGSWAILTLSFGLPRDVAMMALLLSRTIAFWLPIPVGFLSFWDLKRRNFL